jgi:CRP-like cAMP-binding protein
MMLLEYTIKSEYFFPLLADNLFCNLTRRSRQSLNKIKRTKRFEKGAPLFSSGEMPCCVFLLREGAAELILNSQSKNIRITRSIIPNELFGLTEALADLPYENNALSITTCVCECIGRADFIRFLKEEPRICFRLLQLLGLSLRKRQQIFLSASNFSFICDDNHRPV